MIFANKKNSLTLLVVTAGEVVRAEGVVGTRPAIKNLVRQQRPARMPLASAIELAISLSPTRPAARTIVLAEELWTGILDIDERSIRGLEGEELLQMLRFEAESLSGLDPLNSHLGMVELAPISPETRRFWCTAVAGDMLHAVRSVVELRGGKLAQVAHPMGWSGPGADGQAWVEFGRTIAGVFSMSDAGSTSADGLPRAAIAARSTTSDRWYRALATSFGEPIPNAGWLELGAEPAADYDGALETLDEDEPLRRWAGGVLARLSAGAAVPAIAPLAPPVSSRTLVAIGAVAALAVAVGCGAHFASVAWNKASLRQQIAAIKQPAEEKKRIDAELKRLNDEVAEQHEQLQLLQNQQQALAAVTARGDRFAELLRLVAAAHVDHLVVDQIAPESTGVRLSGRAIDDAAPAQLTARLAIEVRPLGWRVNAPELEGENRLVNGGPWTFRIDLIDSELPVEPPQQPPGAVARHEQRAADR